MAGNASNWFKSTSGVKGKMVYISNAAILSEFSDPGIFGGLPALKRIMSADPEAYVSMFEDLGLAQSEPTGAAKKKLMTASAKAAPKPKVIAKKTGTTTVPQRDQATIAAAIQKKIGVSRLVDGKKSPMVGMTDAQVIAKIAEVLQRAADQSNVGIRVPSSVLGSILSGGFLNQIQTGTSTGELDPEGRAEAEGIMFGIPKGSPPASYPVYGYLMPKDGSWNGNESLDVYGDAVITLKDSVRDRTSVAVGDSLGPAYDGFLFPSPMTAMHAGAATEFLGDVISGASLSVGDLSNEFQYLEAQIHGPTTASDIAKIQFTGGPPSAAIQKQLRDLGIPWTTI